MLKYTIRSMLFLSTMFAAIVPAQAVEVYLFRGAGDFSFVADRLTFSQGMDDLRDKIRQSGIHAETYRWQNGIGALADIRKRRPKSVALLGHSMGALAAITAAAQLRREGIKVSYLGLIDIPGPVGTVPDGVMWAENFYSMFPVYGLLPTSGNRDAVITNNYVFGQIHTTMDNSRKVHDAMLAAVWQVDDIDRGQKQPMTMHAYAESSPTDSQQIDQTTVGSVSTIADPGSLRPLAPVE